MKNRCKICNKKVGFDYYLCKCSPSDMFCTVHRFSWNHGCIHDYKGDQQKKLSSECIKAIPSKLEAV
jgi:hypothetical protein